jgi:hypothetical protein
MNNNFAAAAEASTPGWQVFLSIAGTIALYSAFIFLASLVLGKIVIFAAKKYVPRSTFSKALKDDVRRNTFGIYFFNTMYVTTLTLYYGMSTVIGTSENMGGSAFFTAIALLLPAAISVWLFTRKYGGKPSATKKK